MRGWKKVSFVVLSVLSLWPWRASVFGGPLDPRGKMHVPIGIANTLDGLKTFVEAEGNFSPGFGSYGVYFWVFDPENGKLTAPTTEGVGCERGLAGVGYLVPWSAWEAVGVRVKTEVCQVRHRLAAGDAFVAAARVHLTNPGSQKRRVRLLAALRPLGPAGGPVKQIALSDAGDALLVDGHPALVACQKPTTAGATDTDTIGSRAMTGQLPRQRQAFSASGDCSGAMAFDAALPAGQTQTFGFVCPVLPGRHVLGHQWDGKGHAQGDLARPHPPSGGQFQPDPGLGYYRKLTADRLFDEANGYWKGLVGQATIRLPDRRWAESLAAITGHLALCMNEGAPDVAVVNYNVFNRDGVYVANVLQKAGQFALASEAVNYFLAHPFNGRIYPEADNPGQVLWILGEHWQFSRDREWLRRVYPAVQKLAAMIEYYRTTAGPHWVGMTGIEFGDRLAPERRQELKPGRCDGHNPQYTEAFDIAGLRGAASLAKAMESASDAARWNTLAESLLRMYDSRFGKRLPAGYGSYSVLWPCRLFPLDQGPGNEQFRGIGPQRPGGWRYFPLATAHQGLLAGNRTAGCGTVQQHLEHPQVQGWYVMDEGGASGAGAWPYVRTAWKPDVAMPHGWAIAELALLVRDCLMFEDGDRLVLLPGVPPEWFTRSEGMTVENLATHFGRCSFAYRLAGRGGLLTLSGDVSPPQGFTLRLPPSVKRVTIDDKAVAAANGVDYLLPPATRQVRIEWAE